MSEQIELIWEFRGPHAEKTAAHHLIHLKEFAQLEDIPAQQLKQIRMTPVFQQVIWVVDRSLMDDLRTRLKPHRGRIHQPDGP